MSAPALTLLLVESDDLQAAALRKCLQAAHVDALLVRTHSAAEALELLRGGEHHDPLHATAVVLLGLRGLDAPGFLAALRTDLRLARTVVFALGAPALTAPLLHDAAGQVLGAIDPQAPAGGCRQLRELLEHYALIGVPPAD